MSKSIMFLLFGIALLLGAGQAQAYANQGTPTTTPQATEPAGNLTGTIVETMNAGGYTYLCIEKDGLKRWAAIRATQVKVGDEVEIANGAVMKNFTSKTLGRTFDAIMFSQGIVKR